MVATAPCPADKEIAAFLDGALEGAERERIVQHLNECAACHELFVETAEVLDECADEVRKAAPPVPEPTPATETTPAPMPNNGAKVLQHRPRGPRSWRRLGLPLAAVLAAVVTGYLSFGAWINRIPSGSDVSLSLSPAAAASLAGKAHEEILPSPSRGPGDEVDWLPSQEFAIGSWIAFHDFFKRAGDEDTWFGSVRPGIVRALDNADGFLLESCRPLLSPGKNAPPTPRLAEEQLARQFETCIVDLRRELGKSPDFVLGEWAQNARIALLADQLEFFTGESAGLPAWRIRQAGSPWHRLARRDVYLLPADVKPILERLDLFVRDGVEAEEKEQIDVLLRELTDAYDAAGSDSSLFELTP